MKNNKMSTLLNSEKKPMHYSRSSVNREVFFTEEGGRGGGTLEQFDQTQMVSINIVE
jgi:hypothetical protein